MSGDYGFICKFYGLSCAGETYCCFGVSLELKASKWVDIEMRETSSWRKFWRKFSNVKQQYRVYVTEGKYQKKNAVI